MNSNMVRILLIAAGVIVLYYLITRYFQSKKNIENFYDAHEGQEVLSENETNQVNNVESSQEGNVQASERLGDNSTFKQVDGEMDQRNDKPVDCYPRDQLSPEELLPGDANSQWAKINPSGQGALGDQNFLNAGFHIGINTVGQSLRNANLQLRSEPPNPQLKVSPWMQSTIEPDTNRRPLEINGCD